MNLRGCKKILFLFFLIPLFTSVVSAHCPLCVMGAGVAATGALWLGVEKHVVGLFIGAFGMSMGMWFAKLVKKKYVPFQRTLIILVTFFATLLPIMPILAHNEGLLIDLLGNYGSLLNRTYVVNISLLTGLTGGIITFFSPAFSKKLKEKTNGRGLPFQTILITFALLFVLALILQYTI